MDETDANVLVQSLFDFVNIYCESDELDCSTIHVYGCDQDRNQDRKQCLETAIRIGRIDYLREYYPYIEKHEESFRSLLVTACKFGQVTLLRYMIDKNLASSSSSALLYSSLVGLLLEAATYTHVSVFRYFKPLLTKEDAQKVVDHLLFHIISQGNVKLLRELRLHWFLTKEIIATRDYTAVKLCGIHGHAKILRALRIHWNLTVEHARVSNNYTLRTAAHRGNVKVLVELRKNWHLTREDARVDNNATLQNAVQGGHLNVIKELRKNWNLTANDARAANTISLRLAAQFGHVHILREFRRHWNLTLPDVQSENNQALKMALGRYDIPVLIELVKWNITTSRARERNKQTLEYARQHARIDILEQLCTNPIFNTEEDAAITQLYALTVD